MSYFEESATDKLVKSIVKMVICVILASIPALVVILM